MTLVDQSRFDLAVRRAKVGVFQARRLARWWTAPRAWARPEVAWDPGRFPVPLWQTEVPLHRPDADPRLDAGKRVNVALAATCFDGVVVSPAAPLSFWRALGRVTAARGFRPGMELRAGCVVPSLGGGICLLSNALFALAAELGWQILERHGHTIALDAGGGTRQALDATVLWPHVDLRIAPREGAVRLSATIRGDALVIAAHGGSDARPPAQVALDVEQREAGGGERLRVRVRRRITVRDAVIEDRVIVDDDKAVLRDALAAHTCTTCGETECHARVEVA
jgi:vancomycin resistance protein VanW